MSIALDLLKLVDVLGKFNENLCEYTHQELREYYLNPKSLDKYGNRKIPLYFNYGDWISKLEQFEFSDDPDKVELLSRLLKKIGQIKRNYKSLNPNWNSISSLIYLLNGVELSLVRLIKKIQQTKLNSKYSGLTAKQTAMIIYYLIEGGVIGKVQGRGDVEKYCKENSIQHSPKNIYNLLKSIMRNSIDHENLKIILPYLMGHPIAFKKAQSEFQF